MILNLVSKLPCAKVFATNWKKPDIINTFFQLKAPQIKIKAENGADDNNVYIRVKVKSVISERDLMLEDFSYQDIIIYELISKADGM